MNVTKIIALIMENKEVAGYLVLQLLALFGYTSQNFSNIKKESILYAEKELTTNRVGEKLGFFRVL